MQSAFWYMKRLKTMSCKEIIWRLRLLAEAFIERLRVQFKQVPEAHFQADYNPDVEFKPPFKVFVGDIRQFNILWRAPLLYKADYIMNHRLSFFDLQEHYLESPVNWHKDHATSRQTSRKHIMAVNYRDIAVNGDCKLVWEPNRHHQLVVLARAYQVSGQLKYAQTVVSQLSSWLDANPYGYGMNWCNPLELGIRLINWVWAIDLVQDSGLFSGQFKSRVLNSVFLHCRDVSAKFSQGSSANNHLVGEAAGVYIASSYFSMLKEAPAWRIKSKAVLETQIQAQTFADGCSKEHGFGYQFFVFQLYFISSLVGQWRQDDFPKAYHHTLSSLAEFIARVAQGGENYPMLGDQDDGYALDLGDHVHNINAVCDLASHLYDKQIFSSSCQPPSETAFWLFNQRKSQQQQMPAEHNKTLSPHRFDESGYFLLQAGSAAEKNQVSILFDCAELGYTSIAAHGHADALSFVMRINGKDLLIDSGTYDYYSFPQWRSHFRKTKAHNTLEIDGLDQSVMSGPFMWEQHAQAYCLLWEPTDSGGKVAGQHNGYLRLNSPALHQRSLELNSQKKQLQIIDQIHTQGQHDIAVYFHLSEYCKDIAINGHICTLTLDKEQITICLPENLKLFSVTGKPGENTHKASLGWISRSYHQKEPITTLVAEGGITGKQQFKTVISW